ncbi:hypothetical protein VCHENC02_1554A, partial [Vibrio harveyi]
MPKICTLKTTDNQSKNSGIRYP